MTREYRHLAVSFILLVILMLVSYHWIDQPLTLCCRSLAPTIIQVFQWITKLGKSEWYLVGFAVLFVFFKSVRRRQIAANRFLFLFVAVAGSGLLTDAIKPLVGRLRPKLLFEGHLYGFDPFHTGYEYNSLPSGHATTIFALAAALSLFFPRWRLPLFTLAAIVGLSRIVVGAHYLSDVMAGAWVGVMTVSLLMLLCRHRNWPLFRTGLNRGDGHA